RRCVWGEVNKDLPTLPSVRPQIPVALPKLKPNEKIVDPASDGTTAGVYRNIQAAVLEAESSDVVVLIRHTGVLAVNPIPLKKDQHVTIRPYEGHRPILTLNTGMAFADAALFTLYHGQLRFENLEFHLQGREGFDSRTIVALHGHGLCSFKQCVLTL